MIDKLYNSLKESLLYSYRNELTEYNNFMHLCEEAGVPDITDRMATTIAKYCFNYVTNKNNSPSNVFLSGNALTYDIKIPKFLCSEIIDVFTFSLDVNITLTLCYDKKKYNLFFKDKNSGTYDNLSHKDMLLRYNNYGYPMLNVISFNVNCFAGSNLEIYSSVYYAVIHELNHAYEDFQRMVKGKETYQQWLEKTGYLKNNNLRKMDSYANDLSNILYVLSPTEINASVAEIYGKLKGKHYGMSFMAADKIRETPALKRLVDAYDNLENLKAITDKKTQQQIIDNYNEITKQKIVNYDDLISNLKDDLDYTSRYIFNKSSKFIPRINAEYEIEHT